MEELIKIQTELKAPKNQYNSFGKYKYRSLEDILEAVKPILKKYNCYLTINDDIVQLGERYYIKATANISNGKESICNTAFAREAENKKGMDYSQITGATSSYARKYALNGLFCIDDTKDAESTNTHEKDEKEEPFYKKEAKFQDRKEAISGYAAELLTEKLKPFGVSQISKLSDKQFDEYIKSLGGSNE